MATSDAPAAPKQLAGYGIRELLGHKRRVYTLAWSSSGKRLASGSADSSIRIWSLEPHQVPKSERCDVELKGHTGTLSHLSWKPGSDSVLASSTGGDKTDKTIKVWDARSGKCTTTIPTSNGCVQLAWCPDSSSLAALSNDNSLSIVDVRKAKIFKTTRFQHEVYELHWGPTNHQLMMSTDKGSIDVVAMPHMELLWSLKGHIGAAYAMATSKSYKLLASGGGDALICLWDLQHMVACRTWGHMDWPVRSMSLSADSSMLAYATEGGELEVLSTITGERLMEFKLRAPYCDSVAWNPVHNVLAFCDETPDTTAPRDHRGPVMVGSVNIYAPPKPTSA